MAVRLEVRLSFSDLPEVLELRTMTPRQAFMVVRVWSHWKGFQYAEMLPVIDGHMLLENRFRVERGDNITEKFAGYHNVAA